MFGGVAAAIALSGLPALAFQAGCAGEDRCVRLSAFFKDYGSPLAGKANHFVQAADRHRIDWRLLPAIAMVETTGGKHGNKRNIFGWNSGRARFRSAEAAIAFVASRFARSPIYRGRSSMGILRKYNPGRSAYAGRVTKFMLELSEEPVE